MNNSDNAYQTPARVKLVLSIGFGGLLVILVLLGFYAAQSLSRARTADSDTTRAYLLRRGALTSARSAIYATGTGLRGYLFDPDETRIEVHAGEIRTHWADAKVAIEQYRKVSPSSPQLEQLEEHTRIVEQRIEQALKLTSTERRASGYYMLADYVAPARDQLLASVEQVAVNDNSLLESKVSETTVFLSSLEKRLWAVIGFSLVLGVLLVGITYRYLTRLEAEAERRYRQAREAQAQLEQLSRRLLAVQEDERKSLARELHDEVGQCLGAILMDLGQAKGALRAEPGGVARHLKSATDLGEHALQSVRDISLLLRPSMLDDLGLMPALHWQAREINRRTGILVTVRSDDEDLELDEELRTTVYRVVQEALRNAARHSGARIAEVGITRRDGHLQIMVRDDGKGFDPARTAGLGLLGMRERVARLAGKVRIASSPGTGTTLTVELPCAAAAASPVAAETA